MQIRFKKSPLKGGIQFQAGEVLDLPESIARQHIKDGDAVALPKAERAVMPRER